MVRCSPCALQFSRQQSARPNHHAIIYRRMANFRLAVDINLFPGNTLNNYLLASPCPNIQPYPSTRWNGQTLLLEPLPIPAHPAPIPWRFPSRNVTVLTTQASNSSLPVNPPPKDLHTGSRRDSPPIVNSPPTHTNSTVPTPSTSPVLQGQLTSLLHHLVILIPIVSTCQFRCNKIE